ncbi:MAG: tetratricopeptide (TPR) repeat protein [Oleiphilaceae bacterium]|jgi:tetratricopeptide (TPR) repeat protein
MKCLKSLVYIIFLIPVACAVVPNPDSQNVVSQKLESADSTNTYPSKGINDFIVELYDAFHQENDEALFLMWDINSLVDRVIYHSPLLGVNTVIKIRYDLKSNDNFLREMSNKLFQAFYGGTITIAETNLEEKYIKLRISSEDNSSYLAFHLDVVNGEYKIVDVYNYAFGVMLSKKLGIIFQLAYSIAPWNQGPTKLFFKAINLYKSGDAQASLDILDQLPEYFLKPRELMAVYIEVAAKVSEAKMNEKLMIVDKHYRGDPLVSFMLSNLYLANNDIPKSIISLKQFLMTFGPDSEIYSAIANLYYSENDFTSALIYANKSIRLNPNDENAYWVLARVFAKQSELSDVVLALEVLRSYFGYSFTQQYFYEDELFASIANETLMQDWLNTL